MLLSLLILVNIGVIAYFGSVFIRLYEDVKSINEELEDLKQGISFRESIDDTTVSYTHLTLPTKRIV